MTKKIKVLHIFGGMNRGGAEMRTLDVMRHIDHRRYHLDFCALSGLPGTLDDEIRALGGEVHLARLGPRFPLQFLALLRQEKYDVVHSHVHYSSGFILMLAALARVRRRIAHFRSNGDGRASGTRREMQRKLMRFWIDRHATRILAVSGEAMAASWGNRWQNDKRCKVIYNGVDAAVFAGPNDRTGVRSEFSMEPDSKLYVHVGRMDPAKNHQKLIRVFKALLQHEPDARLLLIGSGKEDVAHIIRTQVEAFGISGSVHFAGERTDIPRLLKAADLMIFPSIREGLPGAVLEACAAGTPVLASDLPVIKEIAPHLPLLWNLSVDDDDERWAQTTRTLYAQSTLAGVRDQATQLFRQGPFMIDNSARAHCIVWESDGSLC